jgi:ADP-heptose:LPS heptosyltransferase
VDIPWKETPTFLDLARLIAGCRLFVGNQSVAYVLAQALLVPRIVELWPLSPNNFAHGPKGFEAWSQPVLEEGVKILFEDTSSA